jgi:hypothetical protein
MGINTSLLQLKIPDIPGLTLLGFLGTLFLIGGVILILSGMGILEIQQVTVINRGKKTWVSGLIILGIGIAFLIPDIYKNLSERPVSFPPIQTVPPITSIKEESLDLYPANKTIFRQFNVVVKLEYNDNYDSKNGKVLIHFYFPKLPSVKITEQNKNEATDYLGNYWFSPGEERKIRFGEVGAFTVKISDFDLNENNNYVRSVRCSIKS